MQPAYSIQHCPVIRMLLIMPAIILFLAAAQAQPALIKDKVIKTEVINPGKLKPGKVIQEVNKHITFKLNQRDHKCILAIFGIRPYNEFEKNRDPFETDTKYCHYDEAHGDYLYQEAWVHFLIKNISLGKLNQEIWRTKFNSKQRIDIKDYEV